MLPQLWLCWNGQLGHTPLLGLTGEFRMCVCPKSRNLNFPLSPARGPFPLEVHLCPVSTGLLFAEQPRNDLRKPVFLWHYKSTQKTRKHCWGLFSEVVWKLHAVSSLFNTQLLIFLQEPAMASCLSPMGEIFYLLLLFTPFPLLLCILIYLFHPFHSMSVFLQAIVLNYLIPVPFFFLNFCSLHPVLS